MFCVQTVRSSRPEVTSFEIASIEQLLPISREWSHGYAHHDLAGIPEAAPGRLAFGPMKLFAIETIAAGHGYSLHQHANVEVMTFVLEGTVLHRDSVGGETRLCAETVAVMSAGRGVSHAEYADVDQACRVIQIMLKSRSVDREPRAEHMIVPRSERSGRFRALASGRRCDAGSNALYIDQATALLSCRFDAGTRQQYHIEPGRIAYLMSVDAAIVVGGTLVRAGERVLVRRAGTLDIEACGATEVVVLDMV
jgi:redox-sensitive bicupin YhaK (pirin superfamily)